MDKIKNIIVEENKNKTHINESNFKDYPKYQYWYLKYDKNTENNELICVDENNCYCKFQIPNNDITTDLYLVFDVKNNMLYENRVEDYYINTEISNIIEKISKFESLSLKYSLNKEKIDNMLIMIDMIIILCQEMKHKINLKFEMCKYDTYFYKGDKL